MQLDKDHADNDKLRDILRSTTEPFGTPGHVSHNLLAQIIACSSQAFVIGYPDGSLGMMNEAFERLTGYSAEELKTISWETTLTPPEWREFERLKIEELNRTQRPVRYEKEYIRKDGVKVPIELHVHLVPDSHGTYYFTFLTDITERKNTEEALRQSEERLRSILDNSTDFIYRYNLQTSEFDYVSPSAESVTTYTASEYLAMDIETSLGLIHPEDSERVRCLISGLQPYVKTFVEYRLRTRNGDYRWISNHLTLVQDSASGAGYRYGSVRNITEEKLAQHAIWETADQLLSILDTSLDCVYRYNLQTNRYDYFSPACEQLLGLTATQLKAMDAATVHSFVHPDDRDSLRSVLERLETSERGELEYRRLVEGKGYRWFSHQFSIIPDGNGNPLYRCGTIRDITDRVARERRDQFLSSLTEKTQFLHNQDQVIAEVLESLGSHLGASRCTYIDVDEDRGLLHVRSEWVDGEAQASAANTTLSIFSDSTISTLQSGQMLVVLDVGAVSLNERDRLAFQQQGGKSLMYAPIRSKGRWVSMLTVIDAAPRVWSEEEITLMQIVAERSRLKIENARLIDELRLQSERAKYLSEASSLLNASLDYEATLATIAKLAVPHFADWCVVDMLNEGSQSILHVALEHVDPAKIALARELRLRYPIPLNQDSGLGRVLRTGKATFIPLVTDEMIRLGARDEDHYQILKALGFNSVMIVPLAIHDHVFGALSLIATNETGRIFSEEDLRIAEDIGRRAGLAIENSRLYQKVLNEEAKQRRIAETLQMSLMVAKSSIEFDEIEVDVHYEAALDESFIGGDFGDVFRVDDNKIAFVIGDCTGKGLGAARFVGECQFTTRAFVRELPDEPGKALSRVNRMLLDDQRYDGRPVSALACMVIAVIDTATGAAYLASGGSEPPIVYRVDGEYVEEILAGGPMLGLQDDITFDVTTIQLGNGDLLVLTTDGITEARNPESRGFFGNEGLAKSVLDLGKSQADLNGFAARITADAKRFASGHLTDDACVIVAKRCRQ
jgi:PAS domain S-box-containing protein